MPQRVSNQYSLQLYTTVLWQISANNCLSMWTIPCVLIFEAVILFVFFVCLFCFYSRRKMTSRAVRIPDASMCTLYRGYTFLVRGASSLFDLVFDSGFDGSGNYLTFGAEKCWIFVPLLSLISLTLFVGPKVPIAPSGIASRRSRFSLLLLI